MTSVTELMLDDTESPVDDEYKVLVAATDSLRASPSTIAEKTTCGPSVGQYDESTVTSTLLVSSVIGASFLSAKES